MAFETFPRQPQNASEDTPDRHELENDFFHRLITTNIIESYDTELVKFGCNDEQLNEFSAAILDLSISDREYLYAFPWELKQRAIPAFLKKIEQGKGTIREMVDKIVSASKQQNRRIAYHASNQDIAPKKQIIGSVAGTSWFIDGTEADHRDNDLPMAYYSYDYENLYRVKNPRYLYVVSVQESAGSGHKKDGNNQWGRASTLTIVSKVDFRDLEKKVQELTDDEIKSGQQER
jgi:hypothetical protein